jgi:hypothetical protein
MRPQPRTIRTSTTSSGQKIIMPYMKLGMTVGKIKRTGVAMIDGRMIVPAAN